jgi:hypothetical protein
LHVLSSHNTTTSLSDNLSHNLSPHPSIPTFLLVFSLLFDSLHRGLRHVWGIKVRGQHTSTTGRGRSRLMAAKNAGK